MAGLQRKPDQDTLSGAMNTQTHVLLAAALFARPGDRLRSGAALAGGLLPDLSIFVMWGGARLAGIPEVAIWREMYWQPQWQTASAATNSVPLYLALAIAAAGLGGRVWPPAPAGSRMDPDAKRTRLAASAMLIFALAALSHIATDLPVHREDGHPPFWPFSNWIYHSPVSYWDRAHFGDIVGAIELALAAALITILWLRFRNWAVRGALLLSAASYVAVAHHWSTSLS